MLFDWHLNIFRGLPTKGKEMDLKMTGDRQNVQKSMSIPRTGHTICFTNLCPVVIQDLFLGGDLGVSKNMGKPPKSSILIGFSIINHPFWGTPIFWKHPFGHPNNGYSGMNSWFMAQVGPPRYWLPSISAAAAAKQAPWYGFNSFGFHKHKKNTVSYCGSIT